MTNRYLTNAEANYLTPETTPVLVNQIRQKMRQGATYAEVLTWLTLQKFPGLEINTLFEEAFGVAGRDVHCIGGWEIEGRGELCDDSINFKLGLRISKERRPPTCRWNPDRSFARKVRETLAYLQAFAPNFSSEDETSIEREFDNLALFFAEIQQKAAGSPAETQDQLAEMATKLEMARRLFQVNEIGTALDVLYQVETAFKKLD